MAKIYEIKKDYNYFLRTDEKLKSSGNLFSRISLWQSALLSVKDKEVYKKLAELYRFADCSDYSAKYWYKYLDKAKEKDEKKQAYNGLGNAYFLLGNVRVSNYYLNNAFLIGGALDPDELDEEVVEYFASQGETKGEYKIVYPPEKADYTSLLDDAKEDFLVGEIDKAISKYESVPKGSRFYSEAQAELSVVTFLKGDTEKAIEYSLNAVRENGENILALCNLSSMYYVKDDAVNSRKYYDRAIKLTATDYNDLLKLAMASCEQGEHLSALKYFNKIEEEKPFDINIKYLTAVALYNLGELNRARDKFFEAVTLKGGDVVIEHYIRVTDLAIERGLFGKKNNLKYFIQLPDDECKLNRKTLKEASLAPTSSLKNLLKKKDFRKVIDWAIWYGDSETAKTAVYILASSNLKWAKDKVIDLLLEVSVTDYIKRVILTVLTIDGHSKPVGMVVGNVYSKSTFCPLKEDIDDRILYSYAGCVSILAPVGVDDFSKVKKSAEKLGVINKDLLKEMDGPYLSAIITIKSKLKTVSELKNAVKLFKVKEDLLKGYLTKIDKELQGENND